MPNTIEPSVDMKELADVVRELRAAWKDKDYPKVKTLSCALLEWEPGSTFGLIFLARAAVRTADWSNAARAGHALVQQSPRDAFIAARALNVAGRTSEAVSIYGAIHYSEDWFDSEVAQLAWKEGLSLLKKGDAAMANGDTALAKVAWAAGARLAPHSRLLSSRMRNLAQAAKQAAAQQDRSENPQAYIDAWSEVLRFSPSDTSAATKIALALRRGRDKAAAIDAFLNVLRIDSGQEMVTVSVRSLAMQNDLEDHAIHGLIELGRDEASDPLVSELVASRDAKARSMHAATLKKRLRESLAAARALQRDTQPRRYLAAWKEVLVLDPGHLSAAKRVVGVARQLGDQSEMLDGLIAVMEITPDDEAVRERLISAALRAHQEQRALDHLARHGHAKLSAPRIESLHKRVYRACNNAARAGDYDLALNCFQTLVLVDDKHPWVEALRSSLARIGATSARTAEMEGHLATAVPLAQQVLQIVADQPVALGVLARDMWRHKRFSELVDLCMPRVGPGEDYDPVRKLLERAKAKLAA